MSIDVQGENSNHNAAKASFEMIDSIFEYNGCDRCAGYAYTQYGGALQLAILDVSDTRQSS